MLQLFLRYSRFEHYYDVFWRVTCTISCQIVLCRVTLYCVMSNCTVSCHVALCRVKSYRATCRVTFYVVSHCTLLQSKNLKIQKLFYRKNYMRILRLFISVKTVGSTTKCINNTKCYKYSSCCERLAIFQRPRDLNLGVT